MGLLSDMSENSSKFFEGADVRDAVDVVLRLIRESVVVPAVRAKVERVTAGVREKDWESEIETMFAYVRDSIRYMHDINGVEYIKTPDRLIREIDMYGRATGDCDDHVVLLGSMLMNAGYDVKVVIVQSPGNVDGGYNHIYLRVAVPYSSSLIALDPTAKGEPIGFEPESIREKQFDV